jgi:hypothetical protein
MGDKRGTPRVNRRLKALRALRRLPKTFQDSSSRHFRSDLKLPSIYVIYASCNASGYSVFMLFNNFHIPRAGAKKRPWGCAGSLLWISYAKSSFNFREINHAVVKEAG